MKDKIEILKALVMKLQGKILTLEERINNLESRNTPRLRPELRIRRRRIY